MNNPNLIVRVDQADYTFKVAPEFVSITATSRETGEVIGKVSVIQRSPLPAKEPWDLTVAEEAQSWAALVHDETAWNLEAINWLVGYHQRKLE